MILLIRPLRFFNSVWLTHQIANLVRLNTYLASSVQSTYSSRLESILHRLFHTEESNDTASNTVSQSAETGSSSTDFQRILVVEDEAIIAMDIIAKVTHLGYVVTAHAISGLEAIQYAADTQPDLILMDIRLRGDMNGIDVASHIRVSHKDIAIIFLSAYADENTLRMIQSIKYASYMPKPFSINRLEEAIVIALQESDNML